MNKANYSVLQMTTVGEDDAVGSAEDQHINEDIYCEALAETLHHVALPVTVGFYAPWGRNKRDLLDKIEEALKDRSKQKVDEKDGGGNMCSLFSLIWRIIFYLPDFHSISCERVRYIFINFDAWEYTGCDHTWAGLVSTLLDEIEKKYKILFSVVRAFGKERPERCVPQGKRWVFKKQSKIIFWGLLWLFIGLTLCTVLLREFKESDLWKDLGYMIVTVSAAISGLPFMLIIKNFLCTMKMKLQKDMDRKDLSTHLGFMHSVKEEVKTIINCLHFMGLKEDRDIRVVLKITSLDLCAPDKVVAVLDAINILLCDKNAPFISILAADPGILVERIQLTGNTCSNGYLYLDRIVSLPFSLPQMSQVTKQQLLEKILKNQRKKGSTINPDNNSCAKNGKKKEGRLLTRKEIEHIRRYLCNNNFDAYFPGNSVQMMRIVNTVLTSLTMIKMGFQPNVGHKMNGKDEKELTEQLIDWIVLANFWPCRLSWILQCEEDYRQRRSLEESQKWTSQDSGENAEGNQQQKISEMDGGLLKVYNAHASELDKIRDKISKLLELDGDPELFILFLQKSHFKVGEVRYFSDLLINLDFSLKRQFELLRGLNGITRTNKNNVGSSPAEKH
ncbi:NTPase KAP family P-loop domain-containing protein 1-like [Eublepharis macularius]|uniref:NTPase KAP family P-loop domain-containing protein 1-like n=1 Tax=Eublepharis macularius TaxID=481883 RepID=A0AA97KIP4_EUBMA|nr:NTPase KAP family P-loop domain-containing protein 1-like [Eublepharis macularius]